MKRPLLILSILIQLIPAKLVCQSHYKLSLAEFSTSSYDEFCPVIYKDQIVFCSNKEHELLITYQNTKNMSLFNLFSVGIDPLSDQKNSKIFSKNLLTPFNDGPAAFTQDGMLMVYSRNIDIKAKKKDIVDRNNNLGLFFTEWKDGEWIPTLAFPFNDSTYSITTPCFSKDGHFLYFGSDMPGGYGGADLYRSELVDGVWNKPINLGQLINTSGNEVYPYITEKGDLFFASDGHGGLGKKDIFLSIYSGMEWESPVHLEAPINSVEDDFALITNQEFTAGYLSSGRNKTDDIFQFTTLIPQLYSCDTMLENQYCFEFWDELYPGFDSLPVVYVWEFSDGVKKEGLTVEHCLPGAGKYWAKLDIIDSTTSNVFFTQSTMEFELEDYVQPFITSNDAAVVNSRMEFSGLHSNLPDFTIEAYIWDFGDGEYHRGPDTVHQYKKPGEYEVKMGLKGYTGAEGLQETRCVKKTVSIVPDNQAMAMHLSGIKTTAFVDPGSLEKDSMILLDDPLFATHSVYKDVVGKGFTKARIKTYVLATIPEEAIARINQDFSAFADANFEFNQSEVSEKSYVILDRIAKIMRENPDLILEIAAHTDNVGTSQYNLDLSQKRAQAIVSYLLSKGIENSRLIGKGYGESRPISSNNSVNGRLMNRRVEFIILN
jgi:outer membrane protein OmpA-like peptidoglycan-associated protein